MRATCPAVARVEMVRLDRIAGDDLLAALSPEESARAAGFRFPRDGRRFALRRGWMRQVLAEETGVAPDRLCFAAGAHGKPHLRAFPHLHFNLSHSAGVALLAIGADPLGCDIEAMDPGKADPLVAARLFSPAEQAMLAPLSDAAWTAGFFDIWVRKEAAVKAIGTGLSMALREVCTADLPGWRVERIAAPAGFAAAVALPARS